MGTNFSIPITVVGVNGTPCTSRTQNINPQWADILDNNEETTIPDANSYVIYSEPGYARIGYYCSETPAALQALINAGSGEDNTETVETGKTATAGGNQATGYAITAQYTNFTVVATDGDSVTLPGAAIGLVYVVKNNGVSKMSLYPATSDTINGGSVNAAITVPPGGSVLLRAVSAVDWQADVSKPSTATSITAGTTQTQAGATVLAATFNEVTTVTTDNDGVALPSAAAGSHVYIKNSGAKVLKIYPANGASDTINGLAADAAIFLAAGQSIELWALSATAWQSITATLTKTYKTVAINTTGTATAAQVAGGYITSTSAAAVTITLPTGTLLGAELNAAQGTVHDLYIDNTAGANAVTIAVGANGILSAAAAANGASQGLLTVPSGVTGQAGFRLMFSSATAYTFTRIC